MVFRNRTISEPVDSLSTCEGFQDTPSEPPACLLHPHRRPARADHAGCPPNVPAGSRPLPAPHSQMAGDYPAPDIVAIEHNYCSRRAYKKAGPAGAWGGGAAGAGQARRALNAQRWSCGAAALRSTRQGSRARAQARIEVDEAVDLVVGVHQAAGKREAAEAPLSPWPWEVGTAQGSASARTQALAGKGARSPCEVTEEKEVPAWSSSGPSAEQAGSPDRRALEPGEASNPPLTIHRLSPEEYKAVFSTVVGKALANTASRPTRKCSLDLARRIKEHLYNAVNRPTFREIVHTDGRVEFVEHYNLSSRKSSPPHFELDTTGEPNSEDKASEWAELPGKSS